MFLVIYVLIFTKGTLPPQSVSNSNVPCQLSRSITVASDRSPSLNDRSLQLDSDPLTTNKDNAPKFRTFRGRKRDSSHFDRSRLTKGLMQSYVSYLE